jgi:cyclohexanone monooxygenase
LPERRNRFNIRACSCPSRAGSRSAEAEWVDSVAQRGDRTIEFAEQCTPGYYNDEGQPDAASRQNGFYFGGPMEPVEILGGWRAEGTMKGLERS